MSGTLYIVPTPVGNMSDMSARAIEILRTVDCVLAEDTRTTSVLAKHFDIKTPLMSHHKFNEHAGTPAIITRLKGGENIALVSDAGTPGISDPGFLLSRACREADIEVITLPGPTAFVPALVSSGLPCDKFVFEGFLPPKKGRQTRLNELSTEDRTIVIYESPMRLLRTLDDLKQAFGAERPAAVCREISKVHETTHRGTLGELHEYFADVQPRGEIVIIVGGAQDKTTKRVHKSKYEKSED